MKTVAVLVSAVWLLAAAGTGVSQNPTPKELKAQGMRLFNLLDVDDNNHLDRAELTRTFGAVRAEAFLEFNDLNGNGKVGRGEFETYIQPYIRQYAQMYHHQKAIIDLQQQIVKAAKKEAQLQKLQAHYNDELNQLHKLKDEVNQLEKKVRAEKKKDRKDKKDNKKDK